MLYLISQLFGPLQLILQGVEFLTEVLPVVLGFLPVMLQDVQEDLLRAWHWAVTGFLKGEKVLSTAPQAPRKQQTRTVTGRLAQLPSSSCINLLCTPRQKVTLVSTIKNYRAGKKHPSLPRCNSGHQSQAICSEDGMGQAKPMISPSFQWLCKQHWGWPRKGGDLEPALPW